MAADTGKILGELGAIRITYELNKKGWDVYRKVNDQGFDLIAYRGQNKKLIEVKSRDLLSSYGKNAQYAEVRQSTAQHKTSDYLAIYLHGPNLCFMIPSSMPQLSSDGSSPSLSIGKMQDDGVFDVKDEYKFYADNFELR